MKLALAEDSRADLGNVGRMSFMAECLLEMVVHVKGEVGFVRGMRSMSVGPWSEIWTARAP